MKPMKPRGSSVRTQGSVLSLLFIAVLGQSTTTTCASLIGNGDFEIPDVSMDAGNYPTYYAGESFGGWTVGSGNINLVGDDTVTLPWPGWQAASGNQSVDLTGQGTGDIFQDLFTVMGQTYLVRFAMAGNPYGGPVVKTMEVMWNSTLLDIVTFDTAGHSSTTMGWTYYEYAVIASDSVTRIEFASLTQGDYGPALDDVSVTPVPIPGAVFLGFLGVVTAGCHLRKHV